MNETNMPDPWSVKITENNIGTPITSASPTLIAVELHDLTPKARGYWVISGNFNIHVVKRPNWLHRRMAEVLLGWTWKDS